ncbi:unnamed protein product [Linum trigynum]
MIITFSRVLLLIVTVVICLQASRSNAARPATDNQDSCADYKAAAVSCYDFIAQPADKSVPSDKCCSGLRDYKNKDLKNACSCSRTFMSQLDKPHVDKLEQQCTLNMETACKGCVYYISISSFSSFNSTIINVLLFHCLALCTAFNSVIC